MGKRGQPRTPVALKVKVSGVDAEGNPFVQTAYARDVSSAGARLDGLGLLKSSRPTVEVEYRGKSAKFLVVWIGDPGRHEQGQAGIRSLEPNQNIWRIDLPRSGADTYRGRQETVQQSASPAPPQAATPRPAPQAGERRRRPRYPGANIGVEFCTPGAKVGMSGKLADISLAGCYIEVLTPCLLGTALEVVFQHQEAVIRLPGRVVTVHPGMGMGIEFERTAERNAMALAALIEAIPAKTV
jgi:hypothetical protein